MARKKFFDPRSSHIGIFLEGKGFTRDPVLHSGAPRIYNRSTLEVRQEGNLVYLINYARKQRLHFSAMFPAADLHYFVQTGNFPTHLSRAVQKLPEGQ